jgi:hypothetical protein
VTVVFDRGFVLIFVLASVAVPSAAAISLMSFQRSSAAFAQTHMELAETRALLDAATSRAFHAISVSGDPLKIATSRPRRAGPARTAERSGHRSALALAGRKSSHYSTVDGI